VENSETVAAGAARETMEEANAQVSDLSLYTVFSLPHISQVYTFFRANLIGPKYSSGPESLEVALFSEQDIPWDELAFPVITQTLQHYFNDRKTDAFPTHYADLEFKRPVNPSAS
jgi:ADP-ribose pyrophosphatase YjhB (NUDIX family)